MILPAVLLLASLAALLWFLKGDLADYRRFKSLPDTASRQIRYRVWIAKAVLAFALPAIAGLVLLGRLDALVTMPPEFAGLRALLPAFDGDTGGFLFGVMGGGAIGGLAVGVLIAVRRRRGQSTQLRTLGDVDSLLPRNRAELVHTAALSVSAGVTEELAFRLFLPLLIVLITGNALIAFAVAAALFGAMHVYQGWVGVAATSVVGLLITAVYAMTGALWLAMVMHALIDLNGLVLRPILMGAWRRAD